MQSELDRRSDDGTAAGKPRPWLFRTVRVEDPQLVDELQAAGVRFTGVRPSMIATFFWSWMLPLLFVL